MQQPNSRIVHSTSRRAGPKPKEPRIEPGQRFGRLVVQGNTSPPSVARWNTLCDCGNVKVVATGNLRAGTVKSCGCLQRESLAARSTTHGYYGTPTYWSWHAMTKRCSPSGGVKGYGERGITVCERWSSFENFLADMGPRPAEKTLDRYPDNNGNYEPGNCRWATTKEQTRNKRSNHLIEIDGVSKCIAEWCEVFGTCRKRANSRIRSGWTPEDAVRKAKQ